MQKQQCEGRVTLSEKKNGSPYQKSLKSSV